MVVRDNQGQPVKNFINVVFSSNSDGDIFGAFGTDERQTGHCGNSHGNRSDLSSKRGRWPKGRDDKNDDDIAQW